MRLVLLSFILLNLSVWIMIDIYQKEMINVRAEGECIATLISQGVERKNIIATNGTCKEK